MCSALVCPSCPSAGKNPGFGSTSTDSAKAAFLPNVATNQAKLSTCHCAVSASTIGLRLRGHIDHDPTCFAQSAPAYERRWLNKDSGITKSLLHRNPGSFSSGSECRHSGTLGIRQVETRRCRQSNLNCVPTILALAVARSSCGIAVSRLQVIYE